MRLLIGLAAMVVLAFTSIAHAEGGAPSVELARVGTDHLVGQKWMVLKTSLLCVPDRTLDWTAEDEAGFAESDVLQGLFRTQMNSAGYRMAGDTSDLFASRNENPDFRVGALIKAIQVELCLISSRTKDYQKGSATMDVEWQVYSVAQGRVVARIPTHASQSVGLSSDGRVKLLRGLFTDSIAALAASPEFRAVMAPAGGPSSQPSSAVGPLRLSLASPGSTSLGQASKGVVSILAGDSWGSGVLVSADGYILTNHHVAGDLGRVRVRWADGSETVGEVVRSDKRRDVALVKADTRAQPVPIRHAPVTLGETVFAIGTPREKEFAGTLTRGVVSTVDRKLEGLSYIQSDVAITHGNSGGPLLDEKGAIVGLTDLAYEPDGVSQNINFFIPIEEALKALGVQPAS